jgi:hypothetical protein
MRNILLIATLSLSLGTLAWAEDDFYNQQVASQAQQNSLAAAAITASSATQAESWSDTQPGSMAANAGDDFYNQIITEQTNLNLLIQAANGLSASSQSESWSSPGSMSADVGPQSADGDFYNQIVAEQADINSRFLIANMLDASSSAEPDSMTGAQPGSMASDVGAQSTDNDFYNQTIAVQANVNRLIQSASQL